MKPLTCVAFLNLSRKGEIGYTKVLVTTADCDLWEIQSITDESQTFGAIEYTEDPYKSMKVALRENLTHPLIKGDVESFKFLPNQQFCFGMPRAIRLSGYIQSFRPQPGEWYLEFDLFGSGSSVTIGSFADRASAFAWVYNAVSAFQTLGTRVPQEGWFRVIPE